MLNNLRIAAIGVSHWHSIFDSAYLSRISRFKNVSLVAIQDESEEILHHRRSKLGADILIFKKYEEMVDEVKPDLVIALGSHNHMAAVAHFLLDRNVAFLMEKPMSFSAQELKKLIAKSKSTNGFAAVALHNRYSKFVSLAKEFTATGLYGPLTHFYSRLNRPTSARYSNWGSNWMLDPERSNGGCLRNLGNHGLDIFCYLTGLSSEVEVTGAQLSWRTLNQKVEDYASVLVKTRSNVIGTIETGNCYPGDGTDGEWKAGFQKALLIQKENKLRLITSDGEFFVKQEQQDPVDLLLLDIFESVRKGSKPPINIDACYRAVRLIDSAYIKAGNPYGTAAY